jgi:hypothetical protein
MYTDLFHALLERRNPRNHPLLSALLYEFCPQAAFFWRSGLDPQPVSDPVWQALRDNTAGGTLEEQLNLYELGDFSPSAEAYISDIQEFRSANLVRSPETSGLFPPARPTAEERRRFTQAAERHFGGWDNLYAYIRTWAFLIGDWRLRCGIPNEYNYLLRRNSILLVVPELGGPVTWQVWAWWVKVQDVTRIHIGLLTADGERDPFRPWLVRASSLEGDRPWPGGQPGLHALNYHTGEVESPDALFPDGSLKLLLSRLACIAEAGPYPPLNLLRRPRACRACGFFLFCYNNEHPTELALRGLEDIPTWQDGGS